MNWAYRVTQTNSKDDKVEQAFQEFYKVIKNLSYEEIGRLIRKMCKFHETLTDVKNKRITIQALTQHKPHRPIPRQQGMLKPPDIQGEPEVPDHLKKVWQERELKAKRPI